MASSTLIRLTIETYAPNGTVQAKRDAIFTAWGKVMKGYHSGVTSISMPGLNGSVNSEILMTHANLLMECLEYLDGLAGEDSSIGSNAPLGHVIDFSARPVRF